MRLYITLNQYTWNLICPSFRFRVLYGDFYVNALKTIIKINKYSQIGVKQFFVGYHRRGDTVCRPGTKTPRYEILTAKTYSKHTLDWHGRGEKTRRRRERQQTRQGRRQRRRQRRQHRIQTRDRRRGRRRRSHWEPVAPVGRSGAGRRQIKDKPNS